MLYLTSCPDLCSGQGLVRPLVTAKDEVVLLRDECNSVWLRAADVGDVPGEFVSEPDSILSNGV